MYNVQPPRSNIIGYENNRYSSPSAEIETRSATADAMKSQPASPAAPKERRTKIQFNVRVAVKETIHRNDYTAEELFYSWYRKNDYTKMKQAFAYTVQLMAAKRFEGDTDEMTSRGLEYRHREGAVKRKSNKLNALYAVLDEQERQWQEGYENDVELSNIYVQNNLLCRDASHIMGLKDEEECKRINGISSSVAECFDDEDDMSVSSDESMDLVKEDGGTLSPKSKKKTGGIARFFKKERGADV